MINEEELMWGAGDAPVSGRGAARRSDWFRWEDTQGLAPSASGHGHSSRFRDDFGLLAEHGLRNVRLTLDWSRIEPFPGRIDREELELIEEMLQTAQDSGLSIWLTLHHGSLPGWFAEDTNGFRTTAGPSLHWSRHVDRMAELFDDYAVAWIPVEDPIGWAVDSYALGVRPPGRRSIADVQDAIEGALDAAFDAHRLLSSGSTPVVGSFAVPHIVATHEAAAEAAATWDYVFWRSWSRAITEGVLEWPWRAAVERVDMADAFAAIGIGIAAPLGVDPEDTLAPWPLGNEQRRDQSGRSPSPERLGDALLRASELLPNKDLLVTKLGVHDGDDAWRSALFERWLGQIFEARKSGLPIRGVFLEPTIDGYSEAAGRFVDAGVFTRDREPKTSFRWIEAQQ